MTQALLRAGTLHRSRAPTCGICGLQNLPGTGLLLCNRKYKIQQCVLTMEGLPDISLTLKMCTFFLVLAFRIPKGFTEVACP